MRELGGYIEFEYFYGKEYHEGAVALNSGRHCVEYLFLTKGIKKLYIPYFMCDSVSALCRDRGVEVEYYPIGLDFIPRFSKTLGEGEWLFIVDFYGQLTEKYLQEAKARFENIIVDNTQAFFKKPLADTETCYSCRKFFGVADGGYLYTSQRLKGELPYDYSHERMEFLFGRMEKTANAFYGRYVDNNELFANEPLKQMSKTTRNILRGLDYERIEKIRTRNFAYLHERLGEHNLLKLTVPQGAFAYPLYLKNGGELRKILQREKIYIPTLWPDVFDRCKEGDLEYGMAKNILPLPIDQRYGEEDMEYLIEKIQAAQAEWEGRE